MDHEHALGEGRHSKPLVNWILIGFLLVAGYFLITEHRAHLVGALYFLPYLLLFACPLMHLFMHHGHHDHKQHPAPKDGQGEPK